MLELVKLVKALGNTRLFVELECIMAQCTHCGTILDTHLCDHNSLLDIVVYVMKHQENC